MAWGSHANRQGATNDVRTALIGAVLFGALHINMVLYAIDSFGVGIGEVWSNLVFPITGFAVAFSAICMIFSAVMALRAFGGQLGRRNPGVESAEWLWYAQFVIWFFLFLAIYAVK
jgi:heme/copper-type cytochrome/quinol oxidase subunit 3